MLDVKIKCYFCHQVWLKNEDMIRKIFLTSIAMAFAFVAVAQMKMPIGGVAPTSVDSVVVFDLTTGMLRAKIPVRGGKFSTQLPANENELLGVGSKEYYIPVFVDGQAVDIDFVARSLKGSPLNEMAFRCDQSLDSLDAVLSSQAPSTILPFSLSWYTSCLACSHRASFDCVLSIGIQPIQFTTWYGTPRIKGIPDST